MTIIQPNQESKKTQSFLISFFFMTVLIISAVGMIIFYSQLANFRQEIKKQTAGLRDVETENAELKNKVYAEIDSVGIQQATSAGSALVSDSNPEYIKKEQIADLRN